MTNLLLVVEGQTEEYFVKRVLADHLASRGIYATATLIAGKVRGGKVNIDRLVDHLRRLRHLDWHLTTMLDFDTFTELRGGSGATPWQRVEDAEQILHQILDSRGCIGARFFPYLQLHDFEALVLSDPQAIASQFPEEEDRKAIKRLHFEFADAQPESIDHDQPPCKRIVGLLPTYRARKNTVGPLVAKQIGLSKLRERCPHFGSWLTRLEALGE